MTERSTSGVILASVISVLALAAIGATLWMNHRDTQQRRQDIRDAVALLARANCRELDIIETASMARVSDKAQQAVLRAFYRELRAPISDALTKLGRPTC